MMKLEEVIKNNIDTFNSDEPSDNHFDKFRQKLRKSSNARELYSLVYRVAVVFILIIMITGVFYLVSPKEHCRSVKTISHISEELQEVETYYQSQINFSCKKIRNMNFDDKTEKKFVLSELKELDAELRELRDDLKEYPYDDRVINAIINYYQLKLEFTNNILNKNVTNNI
ncbi:MAG: hypothetical protein JSV22_11630 [Bacteroidales bacterium]|nr:MAG: hypothetical protein JSV22_11630 [Bacteroidales bacterium]